MTFLRLFAAAIFFTGCLDRPLTETSPETTNTYVNQLRQTAVTKIDLLFMVDNSTSMADKQEILQSAVPVLVKRLTSPICVDGKGAPTGESSVGGRCTSGRPEFDRVADIHVGIVTSSLGSHGGLGTCNITSNGQTPNDSAHLLGTVRPTGSSADPKLVFEASRSWNNAGFLAWDADRVDKPVPGTSDPKAFDETFQDMIAASGELGCGYEASLESWYRFLVDPEPPASVTRTTTNPTQTRRGSALVIHPDGSSTCDGCDQELLAQRKAFLRPDSLVAIVMLSDENDCSFRDDGASWRVASTADDKGELRMFRATSACAVNPNDPCCRSCATIESEPPKGCAPLREDAVCKLSAPGQIATWDKANDAPNLRCFDQKRRFGADFLYPTDRYVAALTSPTLTLQSDGKTQVPNPLFAGAEGVPSRAPDSIFLAGIVGVPWQDIADDASLAGAGLKYLSAEELNAKGRWTALLGSPGTSSTPPTAPTDPFMIESAMPRSGVNPITHDAIQPANATSPNASPINGHEQNVPEDLQYACTFPLKMPKTCVAGEQACDCTPDPTNPSALATANSPLCQPPGGGAPTTQQGYAKAYPGTRELQVLKGLDKQGIVASICPKVTDSVDRDSDPNYGYNPAVAAIIDRLKSKLQGECLPRAPRIDSKTHQVQCSVIEARPNAKTCDCNAPGRAKPDPRLLTSIEGWLKTDGQCGAPGQAACSSFCECEILQESAGSALDACLRDEAPPAGSAPGYCYIDDPHSPALANCPNNEKRLLHFVSPDGQPLPAADAVALIACMGSPVDVSADGAL
ncbi:MAG: hypothetical protein ABJB12_06325 [Pseudomonadota bacterium]